VRWASMVGTEQLERAVDEVHLHSESARITA
jgi:hypothetical protein